MTLYFTGQEAVGGSPAQLFAAADVLQRTGGRIDDLTVLLRHRVSSTQEYWHGKAAIAYRNHAARQVTSLHALPDPLIRAAAAYRELAEQLTTAQSQAENAMISAQKLGLNAGDLVGRPFAVVRFVLNHPEHIAALSRLLGEVAAARVAANEARNTFVASMGALRLDVVAADGDGAGGGGGDRRGSDERGGRRMRNDEIFGRSEGGDRGGSHFDNDWAGRAILERYLRGGDDWTITDDANWSSYMMDNELLRTQLTGPAQVQAQEALSDYLTGDGPSGSFTDRFNAEIENGEGIVGYQYLHGTNAEAGDFEFSGDTSVRPMANGTYEVTIDGGYTWNDVIDPNPEYTTDTWKSRLGEVLTLGQSDPYDIHISWHSEARVTLDRSGNVVSIDGYPAP